MDHETIADQNRVAWECQAYQAWVAAYGTPDQAAQKLVSDPGAKLQKILPHLGNPYGEKIANPLGSHGRVAVSLALLGAKVSVFDISAPNKQYATELAKSACVDIDYVVGDFLQLTILRDDPFDSVVMELGVLHYFNELDRFVHKLSSVLKPAGKLILTDFHPLLKKAINVNDGDIKLVGDYFSTSVEEASTPYGVFLGDRRIPDCLVRRWNLGEIVTAFVQNGFQLNRLIEEPAGDIAQLPGTFTLVATAMS